MSLSGLSEESAEKKVQAFLLIQLWLKTHLESRFVLSQSWMKQGMPYPYLMISPLVV